MPLPPLFDGPAPRIFTIPPATPFLGALVAKLDRWAGENPLALTSVHILLPTRRGCRALAEAFLRARPGVPRLLPVLSPLGDVEDDAPGEWDAGDDGAGDPDADPAIPPAVGDVARQIVLTGLIREAGRITSPAQAVRLAGELARLIDSMATERLDPAALDRLVPDALADHWNITLNVLKPLLGRWAALQEEGGRLDPAERRNRRLEALVRRWQSHPPTTPVIAAGSTGTVPATADLLATVAGLPQGAVILPGLDRQADDAVWAALEPGHPDYGMARLLERCGVERHGVRDWLAEPADFGKLLAEPADFGKLLAEPADFGKLLAEPADSGELLVGEADPIVAARGVWVREAMRPAAAIGVADAVPRPISPRAWETVTRIETAGLDDEARAVALVIRRTLADSGTDRAALVTADRRLARRVASELLRFGVEVDDSAGVPLNATAPGAFLRLVVRMVAARFAPVPLLAVLKHPLCALGRSPARCREAARALERCAFRGPRPAPGLDGLRAALADGSASVRRFAGELATAVERLEALYQAPAVALGELMAAHLEAAELLAATGDGTAGGERLWAGEAGEAAAGFMDEALAAAAGCGPLDPADYGDVFDALMEGRVVRRRHGLHPRAFIWGTLEARLQSAEVVILGGLNEDVWPPIAAVSPWMSRPMMAAFGLPLPERRIGLAAHDFAQAMGARDVFLTRARRINGVPTVASRWLIRLEALARAAAGKDAFEPDTLWEARAAALNLPAARVVIAPPAPRPPIGLRPRELAVTAVETWMRDPYAIYARRILDLRKLAAVDEEPGGREFGTLVHGALECVFKAVPGGWPGNGEALLLAAGEAAFAIMPLPPGGRAFWWMRFRRIARWVDETERRRQTGDPRRFSEVAGRLVFDGPGGPFTLTAKADRIDRLADGSLAILDFKTGAPPGLKELAAGFSPQLPLEAAIARAGGFEDVGAGDVAELAFWRLTGTGDGGEEKPVKADVAALADHAREGLARLVARFDLEDTPYLSRPSPSHAPRFSDYEHLARVAEWSVTGDGEDTAE